MSDRYFPLFFNCLKNLKSCSASTHRLLQFFRRQTIVGLLRQKEEWVDREKMLLNQLWAALEEKLELKSMWQESKTALDQTKGGKHYFNFIIPCTN